eukprot:9749620-Alexandrium_andersonii.AAC.1
MEIRDGSWRLWSPSRREPPSGLARAVARAAAPAKGARAGLPAGSLPPGVVSGLARAPPRGSAGSPRT